MRNSQFKTCAGGCVSLLVYVLIFVNFINVFSDFVNNENQREIYRVVSEDYSVLGEKPLLQNDFILWISNPFGPRFGRFSIE